MFEGSIPAVITPFSKNDEIDFDSLENHIEFLISEGSHGLVSCGTTGESPTLNHEEHKKVTEFIINKSNGRVPVMAGCGSNSTKESIDFVNHAYNSGANGVLLVTPYYNKPTQKGLYEHFRLIAQSCPKIPNYLYNIPGRSVVKLEIETLKKLSQIENIVGVKDATADLTTPLEVKTNCLDSFQQLSGEDATFLSFLISGGVGCISVTANVVPSLSATIYNLWKSQKINEAMSLNFKMYALNNVLFSETSPSPVKYALSRMGKCENILRKPMVPVEKETEKNIDKTLVDLNLIK